MRAFFTSYAGLITLYLAVVNIVGFVLMGKDKRRAEKGSWRIRESTLFNVAIIGGSIGSMLGMAAFHHKTHKWYFRIGMPLILIAQIVIVCAVRYFTQR